MCRTCRFVTQLYTCHGGLLDLSPRHLHQVFLLMLSLPQSLTLQQVLVCDVLLLVSMCSHCSTPTIENMQYLVFCSCVSLLRMMVSSFIHVPAKDMNSFFFVAFSSSQILDISSISDGKIAKIFSHSVGCWFTLMIVSFAVQKLWSLIRSHLSILAFVAHAFGVLVMKPLSMPMSLSRVLQCQVLCLNL